MRAEYRAFADRSATDYNPYFSFLFDSMLDWRLRPYAVRFSLKAHSWCEGIHQQPLVSYKVRWRMSAQPGPSSRQGIQKGFNQ